METQEIAKGELGSDGEYLVEFKDGNLRIESKYNVKGINAGAFIEADAVYLVDKITDAIPGEWDDAFLDSLAEKLLSKKTNV